MSKADMPVPKTVAEMVTRLGFGAALAGALLWVHWDFLGQIQASHDAELQRLHIIIERLTDEE